MRKYGSMRYFQNKNQAGVYKIKIHSKACSKMKFHKVTLYILLTNILDKSCSFVFIIVGCKCIDV